MKCYIIAAIKWIVFTCHCSYTHITLCTHNKHTHNTLIIMHNHTNARTRTHAYTHIHVYMHTHSHTHTCTYTNTHSHKHIHIHTQYTCNRYHLLEHFEEAAKRKKKCFTKCYKSLPLIWILYVTIAGIHNYTHTCVHVIQTVYSEWLIQNYSICK